MEEAIKDLKEWGKISRQAKIAELEAVMRFILRNQLHDAFFDGEAEENKNRGKQGFMYVEADLYDEPCLSINCDEINVFENQKELFFSIFNISRYSDKAITITGVKL